MRPALNAILRDRSGASNAGTAYVYQRGTTTQVNCYAADSGGSALPQPMSADSDGRLYVFPESTGQYDLVSTVNGESVTQQLDLNAAGFDGWTNVSTYANGWTAFGGGFPGARYWRDGDGRVHLGGVIKPGTLSATAFSLPAGYRPISGTRIFLSATFGTGRTDILTSGVVMPVSATALLFLDGISFLP